MGLMPLTVMLLEDQSLAPDQQSCLQLTVVD